MSPSDSCPSEILIEIPETSPDHEEDQHDPPNFSVSPGTLAQAVDKIDHHHHHLHHSGTTLEQIAAALETNIAAGIIGDERDLDRRIKAFGSNQHNQLNHHDHSVTMMKKLVLEAFKDVTIILLLCCALLSLLIDERRSGPEKVFIDGTIILLPIFIVATFGNIVRFLKTRWILKRSSVHKRKNMFTSVVRQGKTQSIPASQVVVGDVVLLETGGRVPADGLFINGTNSCKLDDGLLEIGHVNDAMCTSMFTGAKVVEGSCRMLVTSVGRNTERSKLIGSLRTGEEKRNTEESKLQNRIHRTNSRLEKICLGLSLFILIVQVARCFSGKSMCDDSHNPDPKGVKNTVEEIMNEATKIAKKQIGRTNGVVSMLCILVFATRDGFALGMFILLFVASKKMKSLELAMVQKLSACATLGLATTVCLSNTGDLTLNHARMGELWIGLNLIQDISKELSSQVLRKLQVGVYMNTSGSQMEDSLIFWAQKALQVENDELRRNCTILLDDKVDVGKNRSLLVLRRIEDTEEVMELHWKGDLDGILSQCSHYYDADGTTRSLDEEKRAKFKDINPGNHLWCFAFAYKKIEKKEESTSKLEEEESDHDEDDVDNGKTLVNLNDHDHGWILIALVLLKNPYPPEVKQAIEVFGDLGVNVKLMVDADAKTARIMALSSGILSPEQEISELAVIEGSDFRNHSEEDRMEIINKVHAIANATPADKLLIVQSLKKKGEEVAITGSCIRDLPSLIEADVGIFLGCNNDSEMAKNDADIIIANPKNMGEIAEIIRFGRYVCPSVTKFLELHLILNFCAFTMNLIFEVWKSEAQISSAQLVWTNLVVESLGAFALATVLDMEPSNYQHHPATSRDVPPPLYGDGPIITKKIWGNVVIQTLSQVTILMVLGIKGKDIGHMDGDVLKSVIFNCYILCQVFALIGAMKIKKKSRVSWKGRQLFSIENFLFLTVVGMILGLQILVIEIMGAVAHWGKLDFKRWLISMGIAGISALIGCAAKWLVFGWCY